MHKLTIAFQLTIAMSFVAMGGCDALTKPVVDKKPEPPPPAASVKAGAGVAKQGRSLDSQSGLQLMVSYPAVKFFQAKERIVFEIQIPPAVQRFKAIEGRFPKSHEEFMTRVIKENMIQLPELPEGRVYRFNTQTGELYVDPVKQDNAAGQARNP